MKQAVFPLEHRLRRSWLIGNALAVLMTVSATAEGRPARFLVTSAQIMTAMQNRQLPTEGVEVKIAAPITASIEEPLLDIQTIALLNAHTAQIKMACRNRTECLPFYVSATWSEAPVTPLLPRTKQQAAALVRAETAQVQPAIKESSPKPDAFKTGQPQTIHAGTAATLLMDQDRVHLRVRVICLEGGAAGDKVRVTTPDHKQAYLAEIVSPTLLKGSF
jgi:hypothetical protein